MTNIFNITNTNFQNSTQKINNKIFSISKKFNNLYFEYDEFYYIIDALQSSHYKILQAKTTKIVYLDLTTQHTISLFPNSLEINNNTLQIITTGEKIRGHIEEVL